MLPAVVTQPLRDTPLTASTRTLSRPPAAVPTQRLYRVSLQVSTLAFTCIGYVAVLVVIHLPVVAGFFLELGGEERRSLVKLVERTLQLTRPRRAGTPPARKEVELFRWEENGRRREQRSNRGVENISNRALHIPLEKST